MFHTNYCFIEPLDVLFLRGNKLFGDPGSYGESLVPPWPSVAAGALRSLMLASEGVDLRAFARGEYVHPTLGTPTAPGSFSLTAFDLARRGTKGEIEALHALPADLALTQSSAGIVQPVRLSPHAPPEGVVSSAPLSAWPVMAQPGRAKAVGGHCLTAPGWAAYLAGEIPSVDHLLPLSSLWLLESRVGVGLDAERGRAEDGKLFSMQAVAFMPNIGFLAGIIGAEMPHAGMLRLGGDGRGAALQKVDHVAQQPDWDAIARAGRCRIVMTTPGLFAQGWLPPGVDGEHRFRLHGLVGRLVCAAAPRAEVVSGWDLARAQPKLAQRVVPSGSVYWIDDLQASGEQLRKLAELGLWDESNDNAARRAEGFNRFTFAAY